MEVGWAAEQMRLVDGKVGRWEGWKLKSKKERWKRGGLYTVLDPRRTVKYNVHITSGPEEIILLSSIWIHVTRSDSFEIFAVNSYWFCLFHIVRPIAIDGQKRVEATRSSALTHLKYSRWFLIGSGYFTL